MSKPKERLNNNQSSAQVNLYGLAIFSVSLILATGLLTYFLVAWQHGSGMNQRRFSPGSNAAVLPSSGEEPAWGNLAVKDIYLSSPEEYVTIDTNVPPVWVFDQMNAQGAENLMRNCGLSPEQIQRALSLSTSTSTNVQVYPDADLIVGLTPEVRSKFYTELARFPENFYIRFPFCYPRRSFDTALEKSDINPAILAKIKKLLYMRGDAQLFSDFQYVMRMIDSQAERISTAKALTREPALLVRLMIYPDSDIDKILGYWRGAKAKDIRPLLESVQRAEGGGTISLLYLLPPFARERLYTFPFVPKVGDPAMDCHWSTMNFFNDVPDNRYASVANVANKLETDYYIVAKPSLYGDVIVMFNQQGEAIHSAVYIAEDIVFTKNGNNFCMPWKLMRLSDLQAFYAVPDNRIRIYRNKTW